VEKELYISLKQEIERELPEIKTVKLFNNQFENESTENPFLYPCCLLQFQANGFKDLSQGVQQFDMTVTTHLGFESYKDEDVDVLRLKQDLYKVVNRFRNEYFSRLLRVDERPNYNHSNVQVYETDYKTTGKDFTDDIRPNKDVIATPVVTPTLTTLPNL
jgi:hypothetical protein